MPELNRKQLSLLLANVSVERLSRDTGASIDGFEISGHGARALNAALEADGVKTGTMTKSRFTVSDVQVAESANGTVIRGSLENAVGTVERY